MIIRGPLTEVDRRERGWGGMDWIDVKDRDQWRAFVNTGFRKILGNSLSSCTAVVS
jgi:hypothetical protein